MPKRTKSSARWLTEHANDEYVKRAQREGWRSRAVYKLEEIQQRERLLRPGIRCVDLGAAPGSWSQYAAKVLGGKGSLVASDILPMDAIIGVEFVQGDFREPAVLEEVLLKIGADKVDLFCPIWPQTWQVSMPWISPDRCTWLNWHSNLPTVSWFPGGICW
jgi:23S rRNA (uridine2552-2'-O)-methyltransferase